MKISEEIISICNRVEKIFNNPCINVAIYPFNDGFEVVVQQLIQQVNGDTWSVIDERLVFSSVHGLADCFRNLNIILDEIESEKLFECNMEHFDNKEKDIFHEVLIDGKRYVSAE